ncbi:hypothetical protein GCM10017691_24010 [Pseudonocardia petroleophila]
MTDHVGPATADVTWCVTFLNGDELLVHEDVQWARLIASMEPGRQWIQIDDDLLVNPALIVRVRRLRDIV